MLSAASVCYIIILHGLWSKFLLEDNPVNSFNCYMNLKKENKKQMWRKKFDVMMRCMKLALFILFHATFYFCLLVFHLPWKALPLIRLNDYSAAYVQKSALNLLPCIINISKWWSKHDWWNFHAELKIITTSSTKEEQHEMTLNEDSNG